MSCPITLPVRTGPVHQMSDGGLVGRLRFSRGDTSTDRDAGLRERPIPYTQIDRRFTRLDSSSALSRRSL
ncbi:MAG: hypothetical protein JWN43_1990 [Gammaproteobacteria bacterium]|nr:hypothetical protein [Gammaproteobacteria bacterium]